MRIAVFTTNDPQNYSGGRYHALILAYAAAAAGIEAAMVTDHVPAFDADLAPLLPQRKLRFVKTTDFCSGLPDEKFDYVVMIPTGVFHPEFYENGLAFAGQAEAAVAMVNFEAGNWFNTVAPEPKDIRLWSYWQRLLIDGGLCLSSARESARWAKDFYRARRQPLRHEVWCPPINSTVARRSDTLAKDGSILAFVRPMDRHKGAQDLLRLDPALVRGRTITLVAGREPGREFEEEIRRHLGKTCRVQVHVRVSDARKFELMSAAQAVLFPSRFEGFGYPPVEAAYCGTESVCFRLPVLEETVGRISHLAPIGDFEAFNAALAEALKQPERRGDLRKAVERFASFDHASELLAEILTRSINVLPRRQASLSRLLIGPFIRTPPRKPADLDRTDFGPPVPAMVTGAGRTDAGEIAISIDVTLPSSVMSVTGSIESDLPCVIVPVRRKDDGTWANWSLHVIAPAEAVGKAIRISPQGFGPPKEDILIKAQVIASEDRKLKTLFGSSQIVSTDAGVRLRGWVLANQPLSFLHASCDGRNWSSALVATERRDVASKYPSYPSAVCGFIIQLPAGADPKKGLMVALERDGTIVDVLNGWIPTSKRVCQKGRITGKSGGSSAERQTPANEQKVAPKKPVPEAKPDHSPPKHPVAITIANFTDDHWNRGILRKGSVDRLATIRVVATAEAARLPTGTAVKFASGALRRITHVSTKPDRIEFGLDGPLDPLRDGGRRAETLGTIEEDTDNNQFVLSQWTDKNWLRGVWNVSGPHHRRSFFVRRDAPGSPQLRRGALLLFPASGVRRVTDTRSEGVNLRVFLDGKILPFSDGPPNVVRILAQATPFEESNTMSLATPDGTSTDRFRVRIALGLNSAYLRRGTVLRFATGTLRRILGVERKAGVVEVRFDNPIDLEFDTAYPVLSIADWRRLVDGDKVGYFFNVPRFPPSNSLFQIMIEEARRRGRALSFDQSRPEADESRVLFLSLVAHKPANQGNRVVTRNLIQHLVELGFKVDILVQNWVDAWTACDGFDGSVRVISLPFPDWHKTKDVTARGEIEAILARKEIAGVDESVSNQLRKTINYFHPFFIARDEMVETAASLLATNSYAAVIVNYTHLVRVVKELANRFRLPPCVVITHDALSRLPTEFERQKIDTAYRACSPESEAAALDSIEDMKVVAISRSEVDYFREIGVRNPVVLTEYDALEEGEAYRVKPQSFLSKTLFFHGSANPMNVAGLNWFVDRCWDQIRDAVPDARLVVCGRIREAWNPGIRGIEIVGEVSREEMFDRLSAATIAINPCVAGTGLKIKTVEAASLGLPSVCLPNAVDGLQDVAAEFSMVVETPDAFAASCITLLKDEVAWETLRTGSLRLAQARFSKNSVYSMLDAAMKWKPKHPAGSPKGGSQPFDRPSAHAIADEWIAKHGSVSAARLAAETIIAQQPQDLVPYIAAGELALRDNDGWRAAAHGAEIAALTPASRVGYRLMGEGFMRAALWREAKDVLLQAMMVAPDDLDLIELLESTCSSAGDQSGAERAKHMRQQLAAGANNAVNEPGRK